jgi:hypothetical protein
MDTVELVVVMAREYTQNPCNLPEFFEKKRKKQTV